MPEPSPAPDEPSILPDDLCGSGDEYVRKGHKVRGAERAGEQWCAAANASELSADQESRLLAGVIYRHVARLEAVHGLPVGVEADELALLGHVHLGSEAAAQLDLTKVLASGNAPNVTMVTPIEGDRVSGQQITAEVEIAVRDGGIGRVEWRVNGITVGVETEPAVPPARRVLRLTARQCGPGRGMPD